MLKIHKDKYLDWYTREAWNKKLSEEWSCLFKSKFHQDLKNFLGWNGFDLFKFESRLYPENYNDNTSLEQKVLDEHGEQTVEMIKALLSSPPNLPESTAKVDMEAPLTIQPNDHLGFKKTTLWYYDCDGNVLEQDGYEKDGIYVTRRILSNNTEGKWIVLFPYGMTARDFLDYKTLKKAKQMASAIARAVDMHNFCSFQATDEQLLAIKRIITEHEVTA